MDATAASILAEDEPHTLLVEQGTTVGASTPCLFTRLVPRLVHSRRRGTNSFDVTTAERITQAQARSCASFRGWPARPACDWLETAIDQSICTRPRSEPPWTEATRPRASRALGWAVRLLCLLPAVTLPRGAPRSATRSWAARSGPTPHTVGGRTTAAALRQGARSVRGVPSPSAARAAIGRSRGRGPLRRGSRAAPTSLADGRTKDVALVRAMRLDEGTGRRATRPYPYNYNNIISSFLSIFILDK